MSDAWSDPAEVRREIPRILNDGHTLDVLPSDREAAILRRLRDGDRILIARDGRGYVWENSLGKLRRYLVEAILNKRWACPPHPDGRCSENRPTAC